MVNFSKKLDEDEVKVSIIIPVFNASNLKKCLNSVVNQTLNPIEIICIDTGLIEYSPEIINEFKTKYSNIQFISKNNEGITSLYNSVLKNSKGKYVYFVNPDEILEDNHIESLYNSSLEKNSDILIFKSINSEYEVNDKYNINSHDLNLLKKIFPSNFFDFDDLKDNFMEIMHFRYGKFFRKDVISDISFSEEFIFDDYSFFIESFLNSDNVFYDKQIEGIKKADITSYAYDILSISNSFIEISKKYDFYEDLKDFLYNNKIMRTYLHFINVEDEYKKEFFDKIKSDFNFYKNEIRTSYLELINEYIFKEALRCEDYNEFELSVMLFEYKERIDSFNMDFRELHKNEFGRIDIKNFGNESNSLEILEISDQKSIVSFPDWLKDEIGNGAVIESYSKELSLKLKIINDGNLELWLRSIDLRDKCGKRIKILIDYTSLSVDGINYLEGHNLFWHDEAFLLEKKVNDSEIMNLHITWDVYGIENHDLDDESKEDIYAKIRKELLNSAIDPYYLKKMPLEVYGFYIAVLNNESFKEYSFFKRNLLNSILYINKKEISSEINDFKDSGINTEKRDESIIISLTSFPERIYDIHFCLYSLLKQNLKPDKIILWLACEQFPNKEKDLPNEVLKLKNNGLTIKWCNDIKSYKKLIPVLKENPNDFIVTVDDDIYYPPDWLEKIWNTYIEYPNTIIASRPKIILMDSNSEILGYNDWIYPDELEEPSFLNFPTGAGGTMYFPGALSEDVFDEETFMDLCPTGDDIWFWAMALRNNTKITGIDNPYIDLIYVNPARELNITDSPTLWNLNKFGRNDIQIENILKNFPEIMEILKDENEVFYAE